MLIVNRNVQLTTEKSVRATDSATTMTAVSARDRTHRRITRHMDAFSSPTLHTSSLHSFSTLQRTDNPPACNDRPVSQSATNTDTPVKQQYINVMGRETGRTLGARGWGKFRIFSSFLTLRTKPVCLWEKHVRIGLQFHSKARHIFRARYVPNHLRDTIAGGT